VTPPVETRVLIVEDDPLLLRILQKRVSNEGYTVAVAGDGREGMKAIVTFEPDVVISDWMMPEVDGLELCRSVKSGLREAAPYFILLTAKGEISDKLLALQSGADDYVVKPFDQGELMARIRAGARIVSLTQELRRTVADLQVALAELELSRAVIGAAEPPGIAICSGCHRACVEGGQWQDLEALLAARRLAPPETRICPDCARANGTGQPGPEAEAA
jgi:DNA-binding response OmpR family regulator